MYCWDAANSRATCSPSALGKRGLAMMLTLPTRSDAVCVRAGIVVAAGFRRRRPRLVLLRRDLRELAPELLHPAVRGIELRETEPVEGLATLPQRDRVLEHGVAA